jgi:hypothetical protein
MIKSITIIVNVFCITMRTLETFDFEQLITKTTKVQVLQGFVMVIKFSFLHNLLTSCNTIVVKDIVLHCCKGLLVCLSFLLGSCIPRFHGHSKHKV